MTAPQFSATKPIAFRVVVYAVIITNAGSHDAFTAAQTVAERLKVAPDSAATIRSTVLRPPRLVSRTDRLHWQASGGHPFTTSTDRAGASDAEKLPAGSFSFIPHGVTLTFGKVRDFPTSGRVLRHELARLLGAPTRSQLPPALSMRQYGFLLGTAPLTPAARKALLEALASLPGLHSCGAAFPNHPAHDEAVCVNGDPTSTEILLSPRNGVARVVSERLDKPSPLYPNMPAGALVSSDTFSLQPSAFR